MGIFVWSQATACDDILVPMVSWDLEGRRLNDKQADTQQSLDAINRFSIFQVRAHHCDPLSILC